MLIFKLYKLPPEIKEVFSEWIISIFEQEKLLPET